MVQPIPKPKKKPKRRPRPPKLEGMPYCQYCGSTDMIDPPHHIEYKGMGGSRSSEVHSQDNAITLCRVCHDRAHGIRQPRINKEELKQKKADDEDRHRPLFSYDS